MKSLKLKPLQLNDNFPLIISLIGKVGRGVDEEMNLVDRDDSGCNFSTISQIKLYPSSDKKSHKCYMQIIPYTIHTFSII